jgi:hypothetical protein
MSSFQFPANPSDGDVLVRGNLQAFYNAATNTWRVSEVPTAPGIPGPPGPPGPIGPEGKGVEVSGSVATFADLPAPNAHQFEFWIVYDINTLYNSDGITWRNLGGPIQGPQGEHGEDGEDGTDGTDGRGWYDTNIIDERPTNYQVQFLSNDGLGFTTDNIMGPQGETGSLQVATRDTLGGIKIGRGLDIAPDGTASAGVTTVNLETTPVAPGALAVTYAPIQFILGEAKEEAEIGPRNDYLWVEDEKVVQMPTTADGAYLFFFASTSMQGAAQPNENRRDYRAYIKNKLRLTNAVYTEGSADIMFHSHYHNLSISNLVVEQRRTLLPLTKINEIDFEEGAEVTFNWKQELYKAGGTIVGGGLCRVALFPFRRNDPDSVRTVRSYAGPVFDGDSYYYNIEDEASVEAEYFPPSTPEEEAKESGDLYRDSVINYITLINDNLDYVDDTTKTQLLEYRDQLYYSRDLPGTAEEIGAYLRGIGDSVDNILSYKFRFE